MSSLPYTHLLTRVNRTIGVAGPHLLVLDASGNIESSTCSFPENEKTQLAKAGPVRCVDADVDGRYVVTAAEDKVLKVWVIEDEKGLRLMNQRELPKKPTRVKFTKDGQLILVSDKFGDVFSYPIHYDPQLSEGGAEQRAKKDEFASHENPSNGTLILGHASPLNYFVLTNDEKYIITADRDEHIRVSRFPKGYIIEMYCLGHLKFVSALHIPFSDAGTLISAGGDAELKVWDWKEGIVKWEVGIWDMVEKFLIVKPMRRQNFDEGGEDGGGGGQYENGGGKKKRKKAKKRIEEAVEAPSAVQELSEPSKVLVVQSIDSIASSSGVYVLFSAVGATAVFGFPFRADVQPSETIHFDFGKPVLGFSVVNNENWKEGVVVVSLDDNWRHEGAERHETKSKMVRVLKITFGKFVEDFEFRRPLIESLNSKALITAAPSDLESLDLYGALSSLPKRPSDVEVEDASALPAVPIGAPELSASIYKTKAGKGKSKGSEDAKLSKKEKGRLKGKMKVLERVKEQEEGKAKENDKGKSRKKELVRIRDEDNQDSKQPKRLRVEEDASDDEMDET